jgi:hypothetical protein
MDITVEGPTYRDFIPSIAGSDGAGTLFESSNFRLSCTLCPGATIFLSIVAEKLIFSAWAEIFITNKVNVMINSVMCKNRFMNIWLSAI